jgi:hypothetical protein
MRESSADPPTSRLVDGFRLSGVLEHVGEPPVKSSRFLTSFPERRGAIRRSKIIESDMRSSHTTWQRFTIARAQTRSASRRTMGSERAAPGRTESDRT